MEPIHSISEILLHVWRQVSRNNNLNTSTAAILKTLAPHMPISSAVLLHAIREKGCIEAIAAEGVDAPLSLAESRIELAPSALDGLSQWAVSGKPALFASAPSVLTVLRPFLRAKSVMVGPLHNQLGPQGLLLLGASGNAVFTPGHLEVMDALIEPFSAALDNDHRLRELTAYREAAEADKRSLLNRLGRRELGDTIVGADSGLHSVMTRISLVAPSDAPVLILGETGTGKELVARAIHRQSSRAEGPFIRVNCGAIPPELIDSHLFGHEKGAFTGAVEARKGWFERADGGTLFLDEVGELPAAAQVRLLHILQDGWFERVGGNKPVNVNVRIVAATHRDLAAFAAEGRFREDLWYRIAVFPVLLPPLRERREDIPAMARHFAERAAIRFGLASLMPSEADLALLNSYDWPGNVRELGTVMDRAAILGDGKTLEVAKALGISPSAPPPAPLITRHPSMETEFCSLDEAMRRHIVKALSLTRGRIEGPYGAARLLQLNPHTLRARMRKLGIAWEQYRAAQNPSP